MNSENKLLLFFQYRTMRESEEKIDFYILKIFSLSVSFYNDNLEFYKLAQHSKQNLKTKKKNFQSNNFKSLILITSFILYLFFFPVPFLFKPKTINRQFDLIGFRMSFSPSKKNPNFYYKPCGNSISIKKMIVTFVIEQMTKERIKVKEKNCVFTYQSKEMSK